MTNRILIGLAATALAGCVGQGNIVEKPASDDTKQQTGKAEAWGSADAPSIFGGNLELRVASLPASGEAQNIPWASSYWPTYEDNINQRWDGPNSDSAAKKYEKAFGGTGVEDAVSRYHGIDSQKSRTACTDNSQCNSKIGESCAKRTGQTSGYCIPTWWGICHAWSPAAILTPEPKNPVTVGDVTFKINDIKALVSLVHNSVNTKFVSLRCDLDNEGEPNPITFDDYGRPTGAASACRDTNPGTFHLLLTNYLGLQKQSFVYDRTWDDEVWNQPLRGYNITSQKEVTATEANKLIGVTAIGGTTVEKTGTVAKSAWAQQGSFAVKAGELLKVRMTGTGDADLYVKFGAEPTAAAYDCRPYAGTSDETCDLTVPAGATQVFVGVNGYGDSSTFNVKVTTGGALPVKYVFNDKAVKFFHVALTVKFITEASSSTDGNLGSTINNYTRDDSMQYILEVDEAGKIIGGEWVGDSKKHHPDFLWLPTSVSGSSVAGGAITYAKVKELLDRSVAGTMPPGPGVAKTVNQEGTVAKNEWKTYGPFNVAAGATLTADMTGTGDADLYVRKGAAPTLTAYDCRPYKGSSAESCSVAGPGPVYVSVQGYAATSNFALTIKYTEGGGSAPPVNPPTTVTHLNVSGSVALNEMKRYSMAVPAGAKLTIKTAAAADVDLYIMLNAEPTLETYTARGWTSSGNETINYDVPSSGTLNIMVHGYAASSFTLTTSSR